MEIEELVLKTRKLVNLKEFYTQTLECKLTSETNYSFSVKIGDTILCFEEAREGEPFYHFAINIPENQIRKAKEWLSCKIILNKEGNDDEAFFTSWNAHSIYFEDPAGNIIELIARHNLNNATEEDFTSNSFLNISEIGVVRDEVIPFVRELNEQGFPNWKHDSEGLTPVGDEWGLFIVAKKGRRWIFSNREAETFPFSLKIKEKGDYTFN